MLQEKIKSILEGMFGETINYCSVSPIYDALLATTEDTQQDAMFRAFFGLPPIVRHKYNSIKAMIELLRKGAGQGVMNLLFEHLQNITAEDWEMGNLYPYWEQLIIEVKQKLWNKRPYMLDSFLRYYEENIPYYNTLSFYDYRKHADMIRHISSILYYTTKKQEYKVLERFYEVYTMPDSEQKYIALNQDLETGTTFFSQTHPHLCGLVHYLHAVFDYSTCMAENRGILSLEPSYFNREIGYEIDWTSQGNLDEKFGYELPNQLLPTKYTLQNDLLEHLIQACYKGFYPAYRFYLDLLDLHPHMLRDSFTYDLCKLEEMKKSTQFAKSFFEDCILS